MVFGTYQIPVKKKAANYMSHYVTNASTMTKAYHYSSEDKERAESDDEK